MVQHAGLAGAGIDHDAQGQRLVRFRREILDGLRLAVLEHLEIVFGEIGNQHAMLVLHIEEQVDNVHLGLEGLQRLLVGRRLRLLVLGRCWARPGSGIGRSPTGRSPGPGTAQWRTGRTRSNSIASLSSGFIHCSAPARLFAWTPVSGTSPPLGSAEFPISISRCLFYAGSSAAFILCRVPAISEYSQNPCPIGDRASGSEAPSW